jgi:CheY-like chemotaxis protein
MPPPPDEGLPEGMTDGPSADFNKALHDLSNAVAGLAGHAEALSRALEGDPRRKHMDGLLESLSRTEDGIRRLSSLFHGGPLEELLTPRRRPDKPLRGTETVLLVDDEADLRGVTGRFLNMNGYRVLEAAGGEEAIAAFESSSGRVDVLVTDLMMKGLGGEQLAGRLRERKSDLKVLFLSGNGAEEVRQRAEKASAQGFMVKPFRPKDLLALMREVLDGRPASG